MRVGIGISPQFPNSLSGIAKALSKFGFFAPLTQDVFLDSGYGAASFTRATVATVKDWEGAIRNCLSGEVRFAGQRRVRNFCLGTEAINAAGGWTVANCTSVIGATDPEGGLTAWTVTATGAASNLYVSSGLGTVGRELLTSWYVRRRTGSGDVQFWDGNNNVVTVSEITTSWQRLTIPVTTASGVGSYVGVRLVTSGDAIDVWHPQLEDVTGQSNQNPSEYVSVGAAKLNELIYTSSLDTAWWSSGAVTRVSSNNTAPDGTPTAILVDDGVAASGHYTYRGGLTGGVAGATYALSCYIKDSTRRYADLSVSAGGGDYGVACFDLQSEVVASTGQSGSGWSVSDSSITAVGNGWYRCEVVVVAGLAPTQVLIACAADATFGTAGPCSYTGTNKQMYFWGAQLERASSAGTYFPVGSVYPYHGACVDGVKYFATENGNTVASNVVTEATGAAITRPENDGLTNGLVLPGVVGNNASAPHIAAYEFGAGSFTCAAWVTLSAVGAYQTICGAGSNTGADFRCMVNGSDGLTLFWGTDAQAYTQSSTIGTVSANTLYHLVWGYNATTGKVFYALNGTFQEIAAANHALSGSAAMRVGDDPTGDPTTGRVYACRLYNSALSSAQISADYAAGKSSVVTTGAVFDADFSSQAIGAGSFTESSSNAATVTVNTSGIPAAYIGNPLRLFNYEGYLAESARTNLVVRSSDFSLIWLAFNGPTLSAAAAYCGEIALALIGDDGAGAVEYYGQNVAFTADASKSVSFLIKQGTSTSSVVRLEDTTATANRLLVAITWSGGVPICTYTTGAAERAPEYMGGGVWRIFCLTTSVTAANNNQLTFFPATTAALAVANTGDVYIGGVQAENATTASASHIPTTTATVTRNLDYLVYPAAGNVSDTGALYAEAGLTPVATSREIVGLAGFGSGLYLTGAVGASSLNLYDGTNNLGAANTASVLSDMRKAAGSWSGVTQSVCFEGGAVATGPYDGSMNIEYIYAGQCGTALLMNGLVRNIRVATTRVSDADLQLITA